MKKLIIAAMLAVTTTGASAESIAWMRNNSGGHIVLTNEPCVVNGKSIENARMIVTYSEDGETEGCWSLYRRNKDIIRAVWKIEGFPEKMYNVSDFTWK